jgi:hypothetical protein
MKLQAIVSYKKGKAYFDIIPDKPGIYTARLVSWKGGKAVNIPDEIILVRGFRHWSGSYSDYQLLSAIGGKIEAYLESKTRKRRENIKQNGNSDLDID